MGDRGAVCRWRTQRLPPRPSPSGASAPLCPGDAVGLPGASPRSIVSASGLIHAEGPTAEVVTVERLYGGVRDLHLNETEATGPAHRMEVPMDAREFPWLRHVAATLGGIAEDGNRRGSRPTRSAVRCSLRGKQCRLQRPALLAKDLVHKSQLQRRTMPGRWCREREPKSASIIAFLGALSSMIQSPRGP